MSKLVVHYAQLPITRTTIDYLVEIKAPKHFPPFTLHSIHGNLKDDLKLYADFCKTDRIELIECDLLIPKAAYLKPRKLV